MKHKFLLSMLMSIMVMPNASGMKNQNINPEFIEDYSRSHARKQTEIDNDLANILNNEKELCNHLISADDVRVLRILKRELLLKIKYRIGIPCHAEVISLKDIYNFISVDRMHFNGFFNMRSTKSMITLPSELENIGIYSFSSDISCDLCKAIGYSDINCQNAKSSESWCEEHKRLLEIIYLRLGTFISKYDNRNVEKFEFAV